MSGGPLAGVRVVDLTTVVVGPTATLYLADYGAEVIKVESPSGDLLRMIGGRSKSGQLSGKFTHFNRNKRSLALDLKQEKTRTALDRRFARVDNESRSLFLLPCKPQVLALKTPPTSPSGAAEDCARGVGPPLEVSITPRQLSTCRRHFLTMRAAVLF
jgi:hypothetical protein